MDEEDFNLGTGLTVITITFDESSDAPVVELSNCAPHIAIQIFESAAEILRNMMPLPTIKYMGNTIAQEYILDYDEDDE